VLIGGVAQGTASITPNRITLTLPASLAAGPQTAQVMQPLALGVTPLPHPGTGSASGVAAFVVTPVIAPGAAPGSFAVSVQAAGSPPGREVVVKLIPTVRAGQHAVLQMLPQANPAAGWLFDGGTLRADSDTLTIPIPGLPPGTYLVRVLIDGAQTQLVPGAGGAPVAPSVTV
jgi:hypothetical protein